MTRKKLQFPHTCALLFFIIVFAAILTWIIPAGEYDTEQVGNLNKVIAGTYHQVERNPQNLWDVMMAVVGGFEKAAVMMTMVCFVGAGVYILQSSGTIEVFFGKLASTSTNKIYAIVFGVMAFMSVGGAAGVFANATVALIPIGIILSTSLGLDKASGMLMVYLGAYSGFNVGWANPSTLGVAHPIAELPTFSGFKVRVILHIINFILSYGFVMMYINSIKKDHTKSLNYETGLSANDFMGLHEEEGLKDYKILPRHVLSLIATIFAISMILFGSVKFSWKNPQIAATFLVLSIVLGIINKYGVNKTTDLFLEGCRSMVTAAFIIGFANGISIILKDGNILNTIVHFLSMPMTKFASVAGAAFMFLANLIINLFIPSGSGQAAAVMPLMVPMADLIGVTRQVAVQAFQFGDGFSNCLFPTAGTLMGSLAIASVEWNRYAKKFIPFLIVQCILAIIALVILQSIGWTGV